MKICFLNQNLNIGTGIGRYGFNIINNVSQQREIEAIVFADFKKTHLLSVFINALKIRKHIKDCDVIHSLDAYPYGVIAALASIGLKKRIIINGVGTYSVLPLDVFIKGALLKWAYKKAYKVLCISNFTKNQILKRIKLNNIEVINLGVDYDKFQINYQNFKNNKDKIVLSVGSLKPRKGYHISIPAIFEVKKKYPDIKYYIVGGKPQKIYIDMIKKLNIENNVKFLQDLTDKELIKIYYESDIFLLTPITINDNDFEGFGLVYLEAGACGKPAIGTYNCGAEDAIVDKETGFLVPQNDINKTSEAVLKLLNNPRLAKEMGENGKRFAKKMNWDNVIKKYLIFYK